MHILHSQLVRAIRVIYMEYNETDDSSELSDELIHTVIDTIPHNFTPYEVNHFCKKLLLGEQYVDVVYSGRAPTTYP